MTSAPPAFPSLSADRILAGLPASRPGYRVEIHQTIDSTSDELRRRSSAGDIDGLLVVAETQTAGRGRHGRSWVDRPGGSLLFSLGWRAPVAMAALAGLSLATGLAVCIALEAERLSGVQLKWPNDVLHNHCKLGGILVETAPAVQGGTAVIIGIGINVAIDDGVRDAVAAAVTDLRGAGWAGDRNALLAAIVAELGATLERFAIDGFRPFRAAWIARHALHQRNVTIWRAGVEIAAGRAIDVDADGALLVQTPVGVRRLLSGELTLRAG